MSIELEYAVKKDIANKAVVREADARQRAELRSLLLLAAVVVGMLIFSAWQQYGRFDAQVRLERLRGAYAQEVDYNRQLRLNLATLRAPGALAERAEAIGMRPATLKETIVIERLHQPALAGSVVAER
jgi:hypothetical protein